MLEFTSSKCYYALSTLAAVLQHLVQMLDMLAECLNGSREDFEEAYLSLFNCQFALGILIMCEQHNWRGLDGNIH